MFRRSVPMSLILVAALVSPVLASFGGGSSKPDPQPQPSVPNAGGTAAAASGPRAEAEQKKPAVAVTPDRPSELPRPANQPNPPKQANPLTPAVTVDTQPPPPKKPLYKNWGLWAGVGVAAGAALVIGLGVGLSSQSHENFWLTSEMGCPAAPCQVVDLRP